MNIHTKFIILFGFLLVMMQCKKISNTDSVSGAIQNDFQKEVSKIKLLNLPLTFCCGAESYKWTSEYGGVIESTTPVGYGVIGRLSSKFEYEFIIVGKIGDIIYPYLYTYNQEGKVIDSLYLHLGYCDADDKQINITSTTINQDLSINMIDTTKYIHYVTNREYIVDSLNIRKKDFSLNSQGSFVVMEDKTIRK